MIPALIIFAATYVLMLIFSKYRPYIALGSALIFIVSGMLPLGNIFGSIDFNVLLMIAGTMGIVALFIESRMPELLADLIMEKVPNVMWAAVAMSLFELDHFNDLYVASSGNTLAVNVWVSPTYIISDVCDNDTYCTAMFGLYSLS